MADTIVTLDKALNRSRSKFLAEDKGVYMELFDTEEYLINAGMVWLSIFEEWWTWCI